ncbi:hypothetical protein ACTU3I_13025 [Microbacterium sp. RD1]|uniref:hypothetical protein n=1 Tax=Microbacterium sp. RD1 TaxID=3457313 RepID=UPI003FA58CC3
MTDSRKPDLAGVDAALDPPRAAPRPSIEPPSDDVERAAATSRVPGSPHDGFRQLPTAPVIVSVQGPVEGEHVEWEPAPARRASIGPWALGLAIAALAGSLLVGWMLPLGVAAVIAAIVTLRRAGESRAVGVWSLVLAALSLVYSAGWLLWAVPQLPGF